MQTSRTTGLRRSGVLIVGLIGVVVAAVLVTALARRPSPSARHHQVPPAGSSVIAAVTQVKPPPTQSETTPARTKEAQSSPAQRPAPPAVTTPGGMWWGVDSTGPITAAALENVRDWYQGAHPQFWARYVNGTYAVSRHELAFARSRGIYVALLVTDRNCSQCSGGDICGNDRTAAQASADAHDAVAAALAVAAPRGALLIKDVEQVSSCRGEPSAGYLIAWYRAVRTTGYRIGLYGNVHEQDYDFPRAYCAALPLEPRLAADVVLDMNEDEPRLGVPSGSTGPRNAPAFRPKSPHCAPARATAIWQYGESIDAGNYTDIDQARPGTAGLLAPGGGVT